jgi:glycosyltransferase involved in cell wall biosynthesis/SAM-dependent methyltransferase
MSSVLKRSTLIFPPAGAGSKGDEAMIRGALRLFNSEDVTIINPEYRSWKAELENTCDFNEIYYNDEIFNDLVNSATIVVFVGADVLDGSAGVQGSIVRLDAMAASVKAGAQVYAFFSYRSDVDSEIVSRIQGLTNSSLIHFFLRDEKSLERFRIFYRPVNCNFFPDLAFFAHDVAEIPEKNIRNFKRPTIGLCFSEQSFRATRVDITDENRKNYLLSYIQVVATVFPDSDICLISNDIRMWNEFWSDYDYSVACHDLLKGMGFKGGVRVVNPIASYRDIIEELRSVDILITGRMHLAIASFISWTLPIVVTGKSFESKDDLKQRGMFDKARGMLDWCFGRPDFVVTDTNGLYEILEAIKTDYRGWQLLISNNRRKLGDKLSEHKIPFFEFNCIDFTDFVPNAPSELKHILALKTEKFNLEIECRDHLKELESRGKWARHLQLHLGLAEDKNLSLRKALMGSGVRFVEDGATASDDPNAFFTICSKNFLAHARALYDSIRPHYPDSRFFVVLCDRVDGLFDPAKEPFEFLYLEDLKLPNLAEMANRYNITEFNTAVKPFAFLRLLEDFQFGSVFYLDPDLFFVDRMHEVDQLLANGAEAVLTPHILQPAENDQIHDRNMLQFGIYNLGFLALRNTPAVRTFLQWWGRRLEKDCVIRLEEGLFVDQKWADLLPAFVPGTRIIHHPGYNVAYWNLPQRNITRQGGRWMANGDPLRFVHFSGNKLDDLNVFSRHSQQVTIENIGDLGELLATYREQVYQQGHTFYRTLPYAYNWNGEANVNLHTPKELDLASAELKLAEKTNGEAPQTAPVHSLSGIRRRVAMLRQAMPLAKRLSGGWAPFARRAWRSYRLHGWHYVKAKAVELGGYRAPPPTATKQAPDAAQRGAASRRLLYLDWAIPKPDQDAASVTAKLLMEIVDSLGYRVTFVPCSLKYEEGYYEDLVAANIEVIVYPTIHSVDEWLTANANNFDICIMARGPVVWPYLATLKKVAPNLRLIFNTVDLHYLRELRQAELAKDENALEAALMIRDQEFELIEKCDLTILLSQEELYTVREIKPEASLAILPVVFSDIPGATKPFEDRRDILFIGSFPHQPNIDAVLYFAEAVFQIIRQRIPDIQFKVIGSNPPESIQRLAESPGIEILGFVKDLEPVFSNIRLSVAPLRYGAGIKGKIGTSICYGVPCVATPIAIEGMGLIDGVNVLVGETPEQLAEAICTAYLDAAKWNALSNEGHRFALDNYSVSVIRDRVSNILWATTEGWQQMHSSVELDGWDAFQKHSERLKKEYDRRVLLEQSLLPTDDSESFTTPGFCCVCGQATNFLTSFMYSTGPTPDGRPMPNWREHMQCEDCGLVNRMRAAINALHTYALPKTDSRIYITERLTQTYSWLEKRYAKLQGSEYFGPDHKPGSIVDGIRHEDVMNLGFEDNSFDFVLSFDVLEHVPFPEKAFTEIYRVLDENGLFLFSVPFSSNSQSDVIRASLRNDGSIEHHLSAEYHGNPVDPEGGALCFRYFGWDILNKLRVIGFSRVRALAYWSEKQGYLGKEQFVFIAEKLLPINQENYE